MVTEERCQGESWYGDKGDGEVMTSRSMVWWQEKGGGMKREGWCGDKGIVA